MKLQLGLIRFNLGGAPATETWLSKDIRRKTIKVFHLYNELRWWKDKVVARWQGGGRGKRKAKADQSEHPRHLHLPHIGWERRERREGAAGEGSEMREERHGGRAGRRKYGGKGLWGWDVTESNVCSSDFTVYWSRKRWTLDEILIRREENQERGGSGEGANKGIGPLVWVTSDIISSRFHFNSSSLSFRLLKTENLIMEQQLLEIIAY